MRNVEKRTQRSKNDQKCRKMTINVMNYVEIWNVKKNGVEMRNIKEINRNVQKWPQMGLEMSKNVNNS